VDETSWEEASSWYEEQVGEKGHYYHEHVILPSLLPLLDLDAKAKFLDIACGSGILARALPELLFYRGIDASPSLIKAAQKQKKTNQNFIVGDVCEPLPFDSNFFSHAAIILALQNIAEPEAMLQEVSRCLVKNGIFLLVLNHPCFRIPRQTHWGIDESKKLQYRRIDSYLSPMRIPIKVHPSQKKGTQLWAFHYPLSLISLWLAKAGFVMQLLEEWTSDKKSVGAAAKMENRARKEFPLFLAIKAVKI
jgi:SAM-dependent methyltransferase